MNTVAEDSRAGQVQKLTSDATQALYPAGLKAICTTVAMMSMARMAGVT